MLYRDKDLDKEFTAYRNVYKVKSWYDDKWYPNDKWYPVSYFVYHVHKIITIPRLFKIYWKFYHQNNETFQIKPDIFHISAKNIDYVYSLEPPRQGGSKE